MKRRVQQLQILSPHSKQIRNKLIESFGPKRKILVFINPFGGAGAAVANWAEAQPLFDLAKSRIEYEVIETERQNHAYDYVQNM